MTSFRSLWITAMTLLVAVPAAAKEPGEPPPAAPIEPAPANAEPGADASIEITGAPGKGLTVRTGDAFSVNLRARIQVRYQLDISREDDEGDRELTQTANIGTARIWLSGNVLEPEITYMLHLAVAGRDFRDGATSPIFDAFLDWRAHRDLSLRAGQYFVPFDRLRTVREFALQMGDRPRPVNEMTLDRDVGVTVYSNTFLADASPLAYRLSAFGGGGTNLSAGKEPGALLVGRLELRPLGPIDDDSEGDLERRAIPGLAVGGAVAHNSNTNRLRSTTGPTFTGGTTDYFHAAVDLVFKWMGIAVQGEYLWKKASVDAISSLDESATPPVPVTEFTRSGRGWVTQASYTFDPPFEVVGRLSRLYADAGTDPAFVRDVEARGQEVGAGLNYYVNKHFFKLQADWLARMPGDFDFGVADHVVHAQVDATF
jgi:hypothetical protein